MKERAATTFPFAIAAALPVAGLVLTLARFFEGRRYDAGLMLSATLLGSLIWGIVLTA